MRKFWGSLLGAFFICAAAVAPAQSTVQIHDSPGGIIDQFVERYEHLRETGEPVAVSGYCNSACTTILGILPQSQVCVTPDAEFGFHSGFWSNPNDPEHKSLGFSKEATEQMWSIYPARVRAMLRARGWNGHTPHPDIIPIKGTQLYRRCA